MNKLHYVLGVFLGKSDFFKLLPRRGRGSIGAGVLASLIKVLLCTYRKTRLGMKEGQNNPQDGVLSGFLSTLTPSTNNCTALWWRVGTNLETCNDARTFDMNLLQLCMCGLFQHQTF
jgi:hypothetical protein